MESLHVILPVIMKDDDKAGLVVLSSPRTAGQGHHAPLLRQKNASPLFCASLTLFLGSFFSPASNRAGVAVSDVRLSQKNGQFLQLKKSKRAFSVAVGRIGHHWLLGGI